MSKMNLTEATMLALQGKLVENKASKRPKKVAKKVESIDVNVDDNTTVSVDTTTTVVETQDATIIIEEPVAEPEIEEPVETVEVPVEGDETIIPEEIIEPETTETPVEDELDVEVAEDEDDEDDEEFVESVKVTENKKLQEEVDEEAYSIAEKIAKEIEEKGIMNFEEVDARIIELSNKTEEEILNSDFKNSVYGCLNFEGIDQNFSTGDFFTQTYAEQHPEVLEESKETNLKVGDKVTLVRTNVSYNGKNGVIAYISETAKRPYVVDFGDGTIDSFTIDELEIADETKKVEESVEIEVSDDGKEIEVTTDNGEEVEVKNETPDDVEETEIPEEVETIEEPLDENKKLEEDVEAAPFRNMIYDEIAGNPDGAGEIAERLARAWSDDDCKWYCETYELVEVLPDCTDDRYYKDMWGNIRDKWGQIVEEELEENKEVKEETGAAALLGGVNEAIKYSSKSFNEALTKFYKKENSKVESVKLTKFASLKENIKLEAKIKYADATEKDVCLEMKPTSTNKSFVRYSLEEILNKKTEGKTNNQSLNMLTYKTNKNVLECRYISKK